MQVFSIYKVTNKENKKVYIGFDSNWPQRKKDHKNLSFNKNAIDYNVAFHRAIRKHGWDNFEWEVICEHWDGEYTLNVLEPYFIDVYQSLGKNGYNMTKGGEGCLGRKHSIITKKKMSIAKIGYIPHNKGIPHSEESKQKMSKSHLGISSPFKNIPRSKEVIEKMSKNRKGWNWYNNGIIAKLFKTPPNILEWKQGRKII